MHLPDGDTEYQLRGRGQSRPDLAELRWSPRLRERLESLREHAEEGVGESAARLGRILADFVAVPGQGAPLGELAELGERESCALTVRSNASELYLLPWELLSVGSIAHVGFLSKLLIRYEWPDTRTAQPPAGLSQTARGRVVFAWSAAGGKVDATQHVRLIERSLDAAAGYFDEAPDRALDVVASASCASIRERLERARQANEPVAVLHILCHGGSNDEGTFGLLLSSESDPDARDLVTPSRLQQVLLPYAGVVRLVVVSACDGGNAGPVGHELGSVAQALHRAGFSAVIASRFPLSWEGARAFAARFYDALLRELVSLEAAFIAARTALSSRATYDWASLQLYAREADGDATFVFQAKPYRGLTAFSPEHARFFFGREREVEEIVHDLDALAAANRPRFMVVSGASGTGKSSLVMAGALPAWSRRYADGRFSWLIARPGSAPGEVFTRLDQRRDAIAASERFVLVIDQFEEVFTHLDTASASAFVRELWERASDPSSSLCVIATLRLDFLARCAELTLDDEGARFDRVACDPEHQVLVAQMSPTQLRDAIERPALSAGLAMEANLADVIVRDVGAEPGALPLMSHALFLLWRGRSGATLSRAAYQQIGAVHGALNAHAEACLGAFDAAERETARALLVRLVHAGSGGAPDTRRRRAVDDLRPAEPAERERFDRVLRALIDARLLVTGEAAGARETVEVAHEALIRHWARLREWIDGERARLVELDQLDEWVRDWKRNSDALLVGSRLGYAESVAERYGRDLGADARGLLEASREARRRTEAEAARIRLLKRVGIVGGFTALSTFLVVALVLTVRARSAERSAEHNEQVARQQTVEATSHATATVASLLRTRAESPGSEMEKLARWFVSRARTPVGARDVLNPSLLATVYAAEEHLPLELHDGGIGTVALSPDGTLAVSGAEDRAGIVWDLRTGRPRCPMVGHADSVVRVVFSPNGRRVATASLDGTARIWDARECGVVATLTGHTAGLRDVRFSPDGATLVTASNDHTAMLWNAQTGEALRALSGHTGPVTRVVFSPSGALVATVSDDHTASLWDVTNGARVATLSGHEAEVKALAFTPDGQRLATASADRKVRLWSVPAGAPLATLEGHGAGVVALALSHRGAYLATGDEHGDIITWDLASGAMRDRFYGHSATVEALQFSPDDQLLASASNDRTARLWSVAGRRLFTVLEGHTDYLHDLAISADGHLVVTASSDRTLRVWGARETQMSARLRGHGGAIARARFSHDGARVITASKDGTAVVWNAVSGAPLMTLRGGAALDASLSEDGSAAITAHVDGSVRLWSVSNGALARVFDGAGAAVEQCEVALGETRVVGRTSDALLVWDVSTGQRASTLTGHTATITWLALSPDRTHAITTSADHTARVWDLRSGQSVALSGGHEATVTCGDFSPDGARVVTVGAGGSVALWDARSGARLASRSVRTDLLRVAFSSDGVHFVASGTDSRAYLFDTRDIENAKVLIGHRAPVLGVRFSRDGARVLTESFDGTAAVWSASDAQLLFSLPWHFGAVTAADFSPDGLRVVTGSENGLARTWNLDPAAAARVACQLLDNSALYRTEVDVRRGCAEFGVTIQDPPARAAQSAPEPTVAAPTVDAGDAATATNEPHASSPETSEGDRHGRRRRHHRDDH